MRNRRNDSFIIDFEKIQQVQQEIGRLFDGDWLNPSEAHTTGDHWTPATDTIETDNEFVFMMDLPGVKLSNIDVSLHNGTIVVSGESPDSTVGKVVKRERRLGQFKRTVNLPDDADESTLAATMQSGVLSLTVSRKEGSAARSIPVKEVD